MSDIEIFMFISLFSTLLLSFNVEVAKDPTAHPSFLKMAQVSISKNPSFEDPRMTQIKKALQANYGDLKPLTFDTFTNGISSRNKEIIHQKMKEFIFELGGRPERRGATGNFYIDMEVINREGDRMKYTETYKVDFVERSVGIITSHTTNVSCGSRSIILVNRDEPYGCRLTLDDAEEILLGLDFD